MIPIQKNKMTELKTECKIHLEYLCNDTMSNYLSPFASVKLLASLLKFNLHRFDFFTIFVLHHI